MGYNRLMENDSQLQMMYATGATSLAARYRAFMEIQAGPNPLTPAEVDELVARHPERYRCFRRFGTNKSASL